MSKPSTPILAMWIGMGLGLLMGWLAVSYFSITDTLQQVCLVASIVMFFQLLGSTIGATIGKPQNVNSRDPD